MITSFPSDFRWGAATAAYQIEGSPDTDGKGPSIWDDFCTREKAVAGRADGRVACDHYRRWPEDISLMRDIGLNSYRFSLAWTRLLPEGTGRVNRAGLDHYSRLVDGLLEAGIEPCATLYHWDLPLELQRRGGWQNRDIADWFSDYAALVGAALGDRVKTWITLNEPQVFTVLGHREGVHAPGLKLTLSESLRVVHHALLAHGRAVGALRASCPGPVKIGLAPAGYAKIPATESPADIAAARQALFTLNGHSLWDVPLYLDPVFLGRYPEEAAATFGAAWQEPAAEDMRVIAAPLDFIGYNCYSGTLVRAGANGAPEDVPYAPDHPAGTLGWLLLAPDSLYWLARFYNERYGRGRLPLVVTENGLCLHDWVAQDGRVPDGARIDYLRRYILGLRRAHQEGIPVGGYYHWSLLDNFEWAEGYKPRFGLVHVDYSTQRRTLKDSAHWYREIIRSGGSALDVSPAELARPKAR